MRQELIDFLRGELPEEEERAVRTRLKTDAALAQEMAELQALLGLMRRGEEIEPSRELRATIVAAAERATAPGVAQRIWAIPGLVRHRFQQSLAFRVAAVSLGVHLIAMAVLFQFSVTGKTPGHRITIGWVIAPEDLPLYRPDQTFTMRLSMRRLSHSARLDKVGIEGQQSAIEKGIDDLLARQQPDGSFGTVADTGYGALALLAEGECSALGTARGAAVRSAVQNLMSATRRNEIHGAALAALVEDWTLSFDRLGDEDRLAYVSAILKLIQRVEDDAAGREALALARMAGFSMRESRLGDAAWLLKDGREVLLADAPTRLTATAVLARGQVVKNDEALRMWLRPLFQAALEQLAARKGDPVAVLTLQAPYRL